MKRALRLAQPFPRPTRHIGISGSPDRRRALTMHTDISRRLHLLVCCNALRLQATTRSFAPARGPRLSARRPMTCYAIECYVVFTSAPEYTVFCLNHLVRASNIISIDLFRSHLTAQRQVLFELPWWDTRCATCQRPVFEILHHCSCWSGRQLRQDDGQSDADDSGLD